MYVDARYNASLMRIRREVRLPDNAIGGFSVAAGQAVDIRNKIGRAVIANRHVILEAARELGLRDPNALKNLMLVRENTLVTYQTALAGKDPKRGKRVFAPSDGIVVHVGDGRIIFQERPTVIDLEAGVRGTVKEVFADKKTVIETTGALLQGVWGNGVTVIATMRLEPSGGIDVMPRDVLDTTYKNEIVISTRPLTYASFEVLETRGFAGIIAPGMPAHLLPLAEKTERAIMLTDGFGAARMNVVTFDLLKEFDSYLATLNASRPTRWNMVRPELVINRSGDDALRPANPYEPLRRGARVRLTRDPYQGQTGKVAEISRVPQPVDGGLRAITVTVDLNIGAQVRVPLANVEIIGG
jgi:transcription antitermination factor NusG